MGKFLTYKNSFEWEDTTLDRGESIHKLNEAVVKAKEYKDELIKTIDFDTINLSWGDFIEFVFMYGYDAAEREARFPWMSQIHHITLVLILSSFKNTTVPNATNLNKLKQEFPKENCCLIGMKTSNTITDYVYDKESLDASHSKFVSAFDYLRRKAEYPYFKKFYIPELKKELNQISKSISKKYVAKDFKSIHSPRTHEEQIHVHFNASSNCALNIDGTWKHKVENFNITIQARKELSKWGFLLPEEFYK